MNVLLINSKFPPDAGVGTFRVAKFAKYLTRYGCNVHVLTRVNHGEEMYSLVDDVESVKSIVRQDVMSNWTSFIDSREIRWIKPMVETAIRMINDHDIDVVLHSAPNRLLPVGCIPIKRKTGIPYVLDLRDPMSMKHESESPVDLKSYAYHLLTDFFEPFVFKCATEVVVVNDQMNDLYRDIYPEYTEKLHTIYNGFDPEDFQNLVPVESDKFRIVFPGKFRDNMEWFFEPFSEFVDSHQDVIFTHFGQKNRQTTEDVKSVVSKSCLTDYVSFEGYAERNHVFSVMLGADLGLAVTPPDDCISIPTKVFDYMGCNIPILAVDDGRGAMRDVLSDFQHAYIVERDDSDGVLDALNTVYDNCPQSLASPIQFEKYSRERTSLELYSLLNQLQDEV